jgi:hypothetical protein
MRFFHYEDVIPYLDLALLDSETIVTNPNYASKGVTLETKPADVAKKLYESKIVYIHPDSYEKWKNILILLHKKKLLPIKLIIMSGSDYYFDDDVLNELYEAFSETEFWIQNYTGVKGERISILPIGVAAQYTEDIEKTYLFGISYFSNSGGFREEFIEFLNSNEEMKNYCTPKVPLEEYLNLLSKFYFTVCPMGNGFDTHRFWETLMVGTVPIVKKHDYYDNLLFQYPKIPIIVVDSWEELPALIETLTQEKYNSICTTADICMGETDYWINKIHTILLNNLLF